MDRVPKDGAKRGASRVLLTAAGFIAVLLVGLLVWRWLAPPMPQPPTIPAEGVDPVVLRALEAARARVVAAPRSGEAWGRLGVLLTAYNFHSEAIACLTVAERLEPREPRWPYLHAVTVLRGITLAHGDSDAAGIPLLERAADLCREEPDAPRLTLAELLLKRGRIDEAETHFRKVLARDAMNPRAHLGMARAAAAARDDVPGGLDHLRACEDSPFTRRAALALSADLLGRRDDRDAARAAQERAAASHPDVPWPDPFIAEVEEAKVDRRAVLQRARKALDQGRNDEADALYQQLERDFPGIAAWEEGQRLLKQEDLAGAEKLLRQVVRDDPDNGEAHYSLGVALLRQQNAGAAADCFRRVLQLLPDHAAAYEQLGEALALEGDRPGAIEALRTSVRYAPQRAATQRRLGELLAEDGRDAEALEHLRRAAQLDPDDARTKTLIEQVGKRTPGP